jgi:hypothetical protein
MKIHKNGNATEVLKSISILDNSNKQCAYKKTKRKRKFSYLLNLGRKFEA